MTLFLYEVATAYPSIRPAIGQPARWPSLPGQFYDAFSIFGH